nr:hypothetical protein [Tanacetum cinerariifolium]
MIVIGAENRHPMLEKSMYNSWQSQNGKIHMKKYAELAEQEKIQDDCDVQATNIILQGLVVPSFLPADDPIVCLNKAMAFMSTVMASRFPLTNNQLRTSSNLRNQATIQDGKVTVQQVQERQGHSLLVHGLRKLLQALREIMMQVKQGLLSVTIVRVKGIWQGSALRVRGKGILNGSRKRCCWFMHKNLIKF